MVVGHLPRFVVLHFEVDGLPRHVGLDPLGDVGGLERLAVVAGEDVIHGEAGLRAQVAGELAAEAVLHHDRPLALLQDRARLGAVERVQVLEVDLVGGHARPVELLGGLADDAPGRAPADERHLRFGPALQHRRLEARADAVHLAHPLLVHLAADGGVGVLVADQYAVLVVVVRARDVDQSLAAGTGAG